METSPELPADASPERIDTEPLEPAAPLSAVARVTSPLDAASLPPLEKLTEPLPFLLPFLLRFILPRDSGSGGW